MKNSSENLPELLENYRSLELCSHVSLDDVISKVTQETTELVEAFEANNTEESHKEAGDVIVNILSASSQFGAIPVDFNNIHPSPENSNLLGELGKWNRTIEALRGRYSREKATVSELAESTRSFVLAVLGYTDKNSSIADIVQNNTAKLENRIEAYKSDLKLEDYVRSFEDFPKKGINFRDISPMLSSPEAMRYVAFEMAYECRDADVIAGLDARGFLFGMAVAELLGKPFVMIRKKGKLPGPTLGTDYSLEYGDNSIEIQADAVKPGQKVALIDDLLATGGTLAAAANLVEKSGGIVNNISCVISLDEPFLISQPARKELLEKYNVSATLCYE